MTLHVYVAASSRDLVRAETVHAALRSTPGVEVVSTWTEEIRKANAAGYAHDREMPYDAKRKHAEVDSEQVEMADVLLLLVGQASFGAGVEFGYALGKSSGPLVIVAGALESVFHAMAHEQYATDEEAIAACAAAAKGWGRG